jgi:L-amino acid N-acyltransferase YncA
MASTMDTARTPDDLRIRDSSDDDLPAIHAIYAHHVLHGTGSFELEPPSIEEMRTRRADVLKHGFPYLVAEAGGTVLGYAYAGFFRTRPAYRFTVENSVYAGEGAHRRGVGRRLLGELERRCVAAGCRQMLAVIGDSANTGSIALHSACGFRFAGTMRSTGWKFGRWLDTVVMQKELGAGDREPAG